MRKGIIALALLCSLFAASCWAADVVVRVPKCVKACTDGTFYTCQNFEGTDGAGFDNSENADWQTYAGDTGAANPNYTTSPLRGSESLYIKDDNDEGTYAITVYLDETAGVNATYGFFRLEMLDMPSDTYEVMQTYYIRLPELDIIEAHDMIWISPTGVLQVKCNGGEAFNGSTQLSVGTTYYIWYYMDRSDGTDGNGWVKVSTTPFIPEANEITYSGGEGEGDTHGTQNAMGFTTYHGGGYSYKVDQVIVSSTAIGTICAD